MPNRPWVPKTILATPLPLPLGGVPAAAGVLTLLMPICCSCCICCCSCLACQQNPLAVPGHMLQRNCLLIVNLLNICCAADQVEGSSLNTTTKWFCACKRAWVPAKCLMHWTDLLSSGSKQWRATEASRLCRLHL